jgi:hypothetical protein
MSDVTISLRRAAVLAALAARAIDVGDQDGLRVDAGKLHEKLDQ